MAGAALAMHAAHPCAVIIGRLTIIVALLNIAGWLLDYHPLQEMLPGQPSMTIFTATALLVSGSLLVRIGANSAPAQALQLEVAVGTIYQCTLISAAILIDRISYGGPMVSHGADTWLARSGVPSLLTAANVALISSAMILIVERAWKPMARACLGASLFISFGILLGHAFSVPWLLGDWQGTSRPVAIETAILFVLLAACCLEVLQEPAEEPA